MSEKTQEDVLLAWQTFISRGIILEDKVRPIIARSWQRCLSYGLDPWSSDFPKCSDTLLTEKRREYEPLRFRVKPVMELLFALLHCNISICDGEGFVFDLITPLKSYPRTLGTYIKESTCGNGAMTIALHEKVPVRIDGYEKYRVISHPYSSVCSPIVMNGEVLGAINATSPFGALPQEAFGLITAAGKLIESLLFEINSPSLSENFQPWQELIDCSSWAVIFLDEENRIAAANTVARQELGYGHEVQWLNQSIEEVLIDKSDSAYLTRDDDGQPKPPQIRFKVHDSRGGAIRPMELIRKNGIELVQGQYRRVLLLDPGLPAQGGSVNPGQSVSNYLVNNHSQEVEFLGKGEEWKKIKELVSRTSPFPSSVLLLGETGTGKEVLARTIHRLSQRQGNFVAVNCGAIPRELLQSELFGYVGGAFTGARSGGSVGKFEHAHKGTLFLDEIGEMPMDMQVSLLRFLQERTVTKINSNHPKPVDVRIIAATNKNMYDLVGQGLFREDLYYRLNVIEINIPPLRERSEDISMLAQFFVAELCKQFNIHPKKIDEATMETLCRHLWPGNVRELKNVMEKAVVMTAGDTITPDVLPKQIFQTVNPLSPQPADKPGAESEEMSERDYILHMLEQHGGNVAQTAKSLHIARNTLYRRLLKHNIQLKVQPVQRK
ncbi:sigma-54-dependent Fis family transcriptional regulator [Desulfitobacterium chlororespirans]|uniref:Transcriptional regulator containing PAS, AAA-type ATPase, and DNA-binding Fis domains n=1 Tax=Desulfitobacterium chlororespirans DSM 11544 TaxID=1121395 RepID=A0A1M7UAU8_9FIRM|nr:sigma 54-interacting transcriptional regulator [Desulfitobacterium chlororespirans]SHN80113.1 Transcriptional regulator containing PAS, AAA-type ATPase, and DNA-binding Fis domains [Desulfitobacterium chlororespirans DSM 11544]